MHCGRLPYYFSISCNLGDNKIAEEMALASSALILIHTEMVGAIVSTTLAVVRFKDTHVCLASEITDHGCR